MMKHECKVTVIDKKCLADFQEQYLADKKSGPCPFFNIPETPKEEEWLAKQNFHNSAEEAYTG